MAGPVWKKHPCPACKLLAAARLRGLTSRVCTTTRFVKVVPGCRRSRFRTGPATSKAPGPGLPRRRATTDKRRPSHITMAVVTMKQLLDSGTHFGHQTRRWNPKMKRFIFTDRNGIYIIDLQQTLTYIDKAYEFVKETVAHGGSIMFVGTKKQAQESIAEEATRVGMPYVNQPWLVAH